MLRAIIVSLMCMVSGQYNFMLFGPTLPAYVLGKPLIGGLIVGLLYGDVTYGLQIGCALQIGYLSYMVVAGGHSADQGFLSYPIIAIAMISRLDAGSAMAIGSVVAALVASYYSTTVRTLNELPGRQMEKAINEVNYRKINFLYHIWPDINIFLLRFVPSFILVYWGPDMVTSFMDILPDFLLYGLSKFGSFMPAIGLALLLKVTIRKEWNLAFMLLGFVMFSYLKMNILGICIVAACVAIFYYKLESLAAPVAAQDEEAL